MKPDQQSNYWQHSPDASDEPEIAQTGPIVTITPDPSVAPPLQTPLPTPVRAPQEQPINWQATEYIHHERNLGWFVMFAVVVVALLAVAYFFMHSWTFVILVAVMAAAVIVYLRRPPRVLGYSLSAKGLYVADRLYDFSEFKSFGVIRDGAEYSVMLIPIKRFMPGVTVYFPEEAGEKIVDMLGARLPMEQLRLDLIDRLVRKLRL